MASEPRVPPLPGSGGSADLRHPPLRRLRVGHIAHRRDAGDHRLPRGVPQGGRQLFSRSGEPCGPGPALPPFSPGPALSRNGPGGGSHSRGAGPPSPAGVGPSPRGEGRGDLGSPPGPRLRSGGDDGGRRRSRLDPRRDDPSHGGALDFDLPDPEGVPGPARGHPFRSPGQDLLPVQPGSRIRPSGPEGAGARRAPPTVLPRLRRLPRGSPGDLPGNGDPDRPGEPPRLRPRRPGAEPERLSPLPGRPVPASIHGGRPSPAGDGGPPASVDGDRPAPPEADPAPPGAPGGGGPQRIPVELGNRPVRLGAHPGLRPLPHRDHPEHPGGGIPGAGQSRAPEPGAGRGDPGGPALPRRSGDRPLPGGGGPVAGGPLRGAGPSRASPPCGPGVGPGLPLRRLAPRRFRLPRLLRSPRANRRPPRGRILLPLWRGVLFREGPEAEAPPPPDPLPGGDDGPRGPCPGRGADRRPREPLYPPAEFLARILLNSVRNI